MTLLEKIDLKDLYNIKRLGFFLGSFDPLHNGHISVIQTILKQNLCDAVFLYCVQGKSTWKQRSDFFERTKFCEASLINTDLDNVILSYLPPQKIQEILTTPINNKFVKHNFSKITGIIGADIAYNLEYPNDNPKIENLRKLRQQDFMKGIKLSESIAEDSIACSIALPVDDFIVALRNDYSIKDIPKKICDKNVRAIIDTYEFRNVSSSLIKKKLSYSNISANHL